MNMGNYDGRFVKMEYTIWLSALIVLVTLATPTHSEPRVVCYYTNWSVYRSGTARFNPQNINPYLCTHLVYAFGGFTKDNTLKPFDKYQDIEKGGYAKFTGLKTYNKKLKTLLAIGGWNEGSARFSPMVATKSSRKEFVKNAIRFLRQNHFDGLDLDWEYPAFRDGGKAKDRENYAKLVKELREEFEKESAKTGKSRLLLTMAVPAGIEYIQKGFDVKTLNRYLDWMNLLTYDYHSAFEPAVNHHAPLYPLEEPSEYSVDNELNIDYTIKFYLENGADRDKLVVGIPTYGRSYTLFNPDAVEIGSPADGPGEQGEATKEKGYLAYYEICEALKPKSRRRRAADSEEEEEEESEESEEEAEEKPWTVIHPNPAAMGPVAYRGNQWVGYDDIDIVRKKAEYVAQNGLGGIMFWSIDNDDFRGACHDKPYPLIEAAKESYLKGLENTKFIATDTVVKPDSDRRRKNRPRTTTTTTTTTTPKSSKGTSTPSWNAQTPEPPTTPDPGADFKCKDEGFFPHPRDCKKYFWCLDSGPSNLGIVAHQFTCPSGLYFNKAADSCDFARNVLCKVQTTTTKAHKSTTKTTPTTTSTTTVTTTTRAPVRVSTRNSVLFRTTTTTTPEPEIEDDEEEVENGDSSDDDAEDPKVIKELIDLIKKVGGVEQLEKQLLLSESSSSTNGAISTTPTSFNKRLYQKVLDRAIGKNKYTSKTTFETVQQNSRSGPQNAGIEATADKDRLIRKGRPEYVTINRARSTPKTEEPEESEEVEESEEEEVQVSRSKISFGSESSVASTAKPLQYVNIRRARPTTEATKEAEEPSRSRNALFERSEAFVAVDNLNTIDIINTKRDNIPEYVTIKRNRPSYAETITIGYSSSELDTSKETELEREISSQVSQPQYTNIVRTRSTTQPPQVQPQTPEPTTILSVQISSLLNEPSEEEEPTTQPQTTLAPEIEKPEPEITTIPTTTPTTTTTSAPSSTASTTRRSLLRRRGSTSPTTSTTTTEAPESSSQVTRVTRPFLRRTKPTRAPETSTEPIETTTRNLTRGPSRFRNRVQSTTARSDRPTRTYLRRRTVASAATAVNTTSSATTPSTSASLTSRRTLFVNRRRPGVTTLSPTTTEPLPNEPTVKTTTLSPTAFIESEEVLQEIGEIDYLEDSTQVTTDLPRTTEYVQRRRPLVQLQIKTEDQNLAATTEEEKKRQSKKYSSSFKQNELNEIIRQRTSGEVVDIAKEGKTNTESYTSETAAAVALAAHQLIAAPVPVTIDYEDDTQTTNEPYKYTTAYTITQQSEDMLKIPAYTSSKKYYDPTSNTYSSVEVENLSTSTYSTDNTNIRSKQRYTTIGGFSGRSSNSQDAVELPSTVPTYTTNAATKASRRVTGRRYRGRTTTTTTDADVISTIQPSTYEPVTDKRGQIKFNGEYVDSFAGFGFGASKTTDVIRQSPGTQTIASGVNRGSSSRYRINAGVPVTTDSTYEARTTDNRGPEKYKNSVSTFESSVDVQSNTGGQSYLNVQTDERGSEKYSTGKYQDSVSTFESNVDVQSNVGVQKVTDERSSGRLSTGVNRFRISSEAQVAPTDATYEAKITDIRGPAKYSAGEHQGSVSTLVANEYSVGAQSNANAQYNLGAQSNTGERYSTNAQSNINIERNVGAQSNSGGLQSVTSTEVMTTDLRGSEKYATGKYQGSISTNADVQSNANVLHDVGVQSNTDAWVDTDAQSNVKLEYNSNGQVNTGKSVASTEVKTTDIRGSEKYTTKKYQGSISTNADIQSTAGAQFNTGAWVNTDAQSNVKLEYNSNGQVNTGKSVASTEVKTTDIRGSEKYTTEKYQGSISTNADIQSTAGAQFNTGAWVNTDAQSNVKLEYNSNGQVNTGKSVASTEVKTTDIRGSEKYTTEKYQGSISTNADIPSTAGAQFNTGAWVNTDAQSNVNLEYNSNGQVNTGKSVASIEVKTTDIRGSEKYTTGKYQASISTNADKQSTAGSQSNTGAWVNTDAQSNVNLEYNSNGQVNTGKSVASTEVKTTDIRGKEKYTTKKYQGSISTNADIQSTAGAQFNTGAWVNTDAQSNVKLEYNSNGQVNTGKSVASTEVKTTDIRGSEKYTTEKYQGSISTNADIQSTAGAQFNTGAWVNTDAQSNGNTGKSVASTEVKTTDIRGSEKYTTEKYQGSISTNADIQSTAGAQFNTGAWVNTDAQSNVNLEYNSNGQVNTGKSVASTEVKTTDIRGSEKYTTGKYQASISTNEDKQSTAGSQSNTGAWVKTDAQSNVNLEYNSNGQVNTGKSVASTEVKTTDIRGKEKYTTKKYQGSISTNADIQSTAGAQFNTGAWVNTDAQSNVKLEYNSNGQVNTGKSVASTEVKTTDIRSSEKYTTEKYQGSISTNADIQSTASAQFNTGAWVNTDAQSNVKLEYNSNGQVNTGKSVASTEVKTTDIRGSEKYTTEKYQGSISINADIQSSAGAQSNPGAWVNTVAQSNGNTEYNSNGQVNTGQSVASTEDKTTDIRGSEKYTTGKYQGSTSTNADIQSTAGEQSNTSAWVNTAAQSNVNIEYNSNGQVNASQSVPSTKVRTTDIRGSEKYTTGNYQGLISTNAGVQTNVQYDVGTQSNTGGWINADAQSDHTIEYNLNAQAKAGQSAITKEMKTTDIRGSDKYSTGKYQGSISTLEANVSTSGLQSNANVQYDLGAQSNEGERVNTNAQSNIKIESNSNAQADTGQSVSTTEVKTTNIRGSDNYSTGKYQDSVSTFGSNVDVQSNAGVHLATDERGSEKYSIGVNKYEISAEVPIIADVKYGATTTDVHGSEKYKNSVSSFGANVKEKSNANAQYSIGTQSNTGQQHITDAQSTLNLEYNASAQSDASAQSITSAKLKTTDIRGSDKFSTETNQGSGSSFKTNVNKESYSGVQLANDERGSGKYYVARNRYRISTEAPVTTDSTYEARITDIRGSEKHKSSVSTFDTNVDVQSNTGTKSNVLTTSDEQSAGKYSLDVNKFISADASVTATDATYGARTTDIRGSEKYKTSVSSLETNGNVLSNASVQSNLGLQTTTDERGSEKYSTETYQSSISLEANKEGQNNTNVQYNIDSQLNTGNQSITAAEVKTTDISGSEKYSSEINHGSVTDFENNVNIQSNSGVRFTTDERNSGKYITTEAPVTTDSTYEARVTDLRGSEKYKNSVSAFESNVDVKSNARTQSNVGAQTSTDEKGTGKYSVRVNRFRVSADKPVTTTDATYGARTTDIRGSEKYSTEKYEGLIYLEASKDAQSNANVQYSKDLKSNTGAQSVTSAEVPTSDIRGSEKYTTGSNQGTISSFETNVNVQSNLGVQLETDEGSSGKYSVNVNRYRINAEAPVTTTSTSYEAKTTDVRGSEKYKTSVSTLETNVDVKSNAQSQFNAGVQNVSAERSSEKYSTGKYEGSVSTFGTNTEAQSNVQILNDEQRGEKYSIGGNRHRIGVKRFRVTTEAPVQSTDATYATSITDMRGSEKYSAGRNKEVISTFETNANLQSDVNVQYNTGAELIAPTVPITFGVKTTDISGSDKYSIGGNRRRIGVKRFRVTTESPVLITDATYATSTTDMRGSEKYSAGRNKESISTFETNADLQSDLNVKYNGGVELITSTVPITFGVKTTDISGSDKYSSGKYEGSAFEANIEIQSNGGFQSVSSPVPVAYEVKTTDQRGPLKYASGQNQSSIMNVETNVDVQSNSGTQSYTNLQYDTTAQSNTGIQSNTNARYNANAQANTGKFRNNNKQSNINVEFDANALSNANLAYNVDVQSNANIEYNTDAQSNVNLQYNVDANSEAGVQSGSSTKIKSTDIRGSDKYSTGKYEGSISTLGANIDKQFNKGIQSVSPQVPVSYEVNSTDNRGPMKYAAGEYQSSVSTFEANLQSNGNAEPYANAQYGSNVQTNGDSQYYLNTQSNINIDNARVQSTVDKQTNTNTQFNANAQFNSNAQNNSSGQYSTDAQSKTNLDYNASAQANTGAQYNANAQLIINAQYDAGASHTGEIKSVISSVPVIYESKTTDIQSLENNSSVKFDTSMFETNVDVQSNAGAQYNASVQSDAKIQSNTNGQFISSTVPLSYEFNATEIRGPAKYSSGTNKESVTSFQDNATGQSISSTRPTSYKIRTKGRRPTKFSGGYRNKVTNVESDADVISTLQPTTYESQTTDIRGETKYSTAEYRDSATRFESTVDGISTTQPTMSTYEIKTKGPGKYWTGQYRSRTSSSLQTDEDSVSTVQPTTYEADTTDIRGSSRYSAEEYRGRVSEVQTNTDIPFVSTIQSYESDTSDTRGPIRYSTVDAYADGTYNENTDSDVISNRISTTYTPEIVNTRVPTRFTTANAYRGSTVQTDTEIPSTVSTITEYSFDSTLGKSASRTSQTGYRGRYSSEAEISERTSGRTDVRQPTRLMTGSYSGRGTRPTIASESIDSLTVSGGLSEATQERGAAKYYVTSDITDIREPAQFSSSLDLRGSARFAGSETLTGRTLRPGFLPQNTIDPILSGITINIGAEKGDSTARYNSATDGSATTLSASEYDSRKSSQSASNVVNSGDELSINIGESTATTASPSTVKSARPTGFTPSLLNLGEIAEEKSSLKYQISQKSNSNQGNERGPSTARYEENEKIPVPVIYAYSSSGSSSSSSSSAEPSYFTREYLLESPVTKTYEEEYQYLSPVTIPSTTGRQSIRRKIYRKYNAQKPVENISTTTTTETPSPSTEAPTPKRRTTTAKPFQKLTVRRVPLQSVQKITLSKKEIEEAKQKFKPAKDYDYYDDNHEKIAKYDGTKVIVRGEGNIQCLDIGNFPHPTSCKKFISCARIESGAVLGWEYICPKGLSFDPVGGICNWSAGLGCNEKDI